MTGLFSLGQVLFLLLLASQCFSMVFEPLGDSPVQRPLDFSPDHAHFRPGTEDDLDEITTVILDAFMPSETYRYVFPQLDYKYHWKCMREEIGREFADRPENAWINVITVPNPQSSADPHAKGTNRVVAVAGWKIIEPQTKSSCHEDIWRLDTYRTIAKCSERLDWNMTRAADFGRQMGLIEKRYLYGYEHTQMYLAILATHPDWDGHGFGAAHCYWGMKMAEARNITTTLIASPAGWVLYDSLGFESVHNITITTIDWPVNLWQEYMQYRS